MTFKAKVIQSWKGRLRGEVLITTGRISFLGDIDQTSGEIIGSDLDIKGESITNKIFIFSEGRGSTVGSNVLYGLAKNGLAPKLIATEKTELITISGAIYGEIPMITNLSREVFESVKSGDVMSARIIDGIAYLEKA
jgi:predicted aconitase with swiveling domain